MLHYCGNCKERSVVRKIYIRKKDGEQSRVEYCINKGCGYRCELPFSYNMRPAFASVLIAISLCLSGTAFASSVDLTAIKKIESNGNALAYNRGSGARGLYQITNIVLVEYNRINRAGYKAGDLFNPATNLKIAEWYLTKRIPQMLKHYKKPLTINNILIAYNAGIGYVVKGKPLPTETRNYIKKYERLTRGN